MRLNTCRITDGAGKIPFICFDLAGGANIANSNVLVGGSGGQSDLISTQGYEKMGLPGDMVPGLNDANGDPFANFDLGLGFPSRQCISSRYHGKPHTRNGSQR